MPIVTLHSETTYPMKEHSSCHISAPTTIKRNANKNEVKVIKLKHQYQLNNLKLEGDPKLIQLDSYFRKYTIPVLYRHYDFKMKQHLNDEVARKDPKVVNGTYIYHEILFSTKPIKYAPPDEGEDNGEPIPPIDEFLESAKEQNCFSKDTYDEEFKAALLLQTSRLQEESGWDSDFHKVNSMLSILSTLTCFPQAPHTDYPNDDTFDDSHQKSFIFGISEKGTYLMVWRKDEPNDPILLYIPYGYGILFGKALIHAGGLRFSTEFDAVFQNPIMGCPRVHMYLVKDNYMIPANFICYANDKNNHEPYGETFMTASSAICIACCTEAPEKRTSKKEKKRKSGGFPEPTGCCKAPTI